MSTDRRAPRRLEIETKWRVTNGGLVVEKKTVRTREGPTRVPTA